MRGLGVHGEGVLREIGALCRCIRGQDAKMPSGMDPKIDIDIEACWERVSGEDGCHMVRTDDRGG